MSYFDLIEEILPLILSSCGLTGGIFSAVIFFAIKRAKVEAEIKRKERLRLEIMRLEGEEKLSKLIFALIRHTRTHGNAHELDEAEKAYTEYLLNCSKLKNEIISNHTSG